MNVFTEWDGLNDWKQKNAQRAAEHEQQQKAEKLLRYLLAKEAAYLALLDPHFSFKRKVAPLASNIAERFQLEDEEAVSLVRDMEALRDQIVQVAQRQKDEDDRFDEAAKWEPDGTHTVASFFAKEELKAGKNQDDVRAETKAKYNLNDEEVNEIMAKVAEEQP